MKLRSSPDALSTVFNSDRSNHEIAEFLSDRLAELI